MFLEGISFLVCLKGDPFISCGTRLREVVGSKEKGDVSSPVLLCIPVYFNIPIFKIILIKKY
jgi:hypothetical protein